MENLVKESPALLKTEGANNLNIPLSWLGNELWVVLDVLKLADQSKTWMRLTWFWEAFFT